MGSLALDLGWCHAGQTHESRHTHTHTHTKSSRYADTHADARAQITHKLDSQCKTGHRFGAHYEYQDSQVFNSQAVSGCCQRIKTHTLTHARTLTHTNTPARTQQQLTHAVSLESYPETYFHIGYFHCVSPLMKVFSYY